MAFVSSLHPSLRAYYILNCDAIFAGPAPRNPDPECDPEYRESPWCGEEQPSGFKPFWASKCLESTATQRMEKPTAAHNPEVVGSSPAPATTKSPLSSRKAVFFFHFCNFGRRPRFPDTGVTQTVTQTGQKIGPEAAFPPPGFLSFLWRQRAFARTFPMVFAASFWAAVVTWA